MQDFDRSLGQEATTAEDLSGLHAPALESESMLKVRFETVYVREVALRYRGPARSIESPLRGPADAARFARKLLSDDSREHFLAIHLDGRHRPIAHSIVSVGTATASLVHPRELYQSAIMVGAVALILLHNHPSGDPRPSTEDRELTTRLAEVGRVVGIEVLDHVVFTRDGSFHSLRDESPSLFTTKASLT